MDSTDVSPALAALWPPYGTVLRTRDLVMRPLTETDLPAYVAAYDDDVELDPALAHYPALDVRTDRVTRIQQYLLRSRATWRPDSWVWQFGAFRSGVLVGGQTLEADNYRHTGTVDTASFLRPQVRRPDHGLRPLDRHAAVTSALRDNQASLAVSRAIGYIYTGSSDHSVGSDSNTMLHLRLTRQT